MITLENYKEKLGENIDWYYISRYQKLSEGFIREFQDKVDWFWISYNQKLSEEFIREFQDKLDWDEISTYQNLSEDFIREFQDKVNGNYIIKPEESKLMEKQTSESNYTVIWKKSRNKVNQKLVFVNDLVLIDNKEIPYIIIEDKGDDVIAEKDGFSIEISKKNVFPIYEQDSIDDIKVGDIILDEADNFGIVTKIDNGLYHLSDNTKIDFTLIKKLYSFSNKLEKYEEFKCGKVKFKSEIFSNRDNLINKYPNSKFKAKKIDYTHLDLSISEHYNIDIDYIKPKDEDILKHLKTSLDHPLNVETKEWALLVGPSGSGKTEVCISYAKDKNQEYVKLQGNAQVTVDDLIGYKSITTGEYFPSLLRDAVENGKLFIIDEIDACNPNTILTLNGLKQEYFQFPDKLVKIHEDFRLVATANTLEYNETYNSRMPLDKASLARFDIIEYNMKEYELAIRYGLEYIKKVSNITKLTPREVQREVTKMKIKES